MHGNVFVVFFYMGITFSALNYYLINRDREDLSMKPEGIQETLAFTLEILAAGIILFYPPASVLIPVLIYDIVRSRNYIGAAISIMAMINSFTSLKSYSEHGILISCYILSLMITSFILSIRTEKNELLNRKYKRLRDDSAEKSERLRLQNTELLQAKDSEVFSAQLAERNRIAREIHDNVGHMLSRGLLQMGALLAIYKDEPIHTQLENVRHTLDTAMNNIRSSVLCLLY